ncbi:YaiI/YqxD family protein [Staphylococcus pasteuri]|uniref:YaiI/YqxD family protein n=1 Tax=Staphylococcus TaxID=1279 RepID=UPI00048C34F6|nr:MULTISPECIES: YaiI/YqxD family protein [Staphylococcus]MBL3398428.1 YaiI/YqxD family protein [Staphylococcus pasteuri]MCT1926166.1 YaiI/YqxD family protein [Staphylococcus pasteuri]QQT10728.1 YaiI/YqxD family protein [Staphylococcus pasteuri]RIO53979.1 YaiI/YqxD family protein [Staphylococcus pasteuri]RNM18769.1 YaiI/YqxD family protein [Staphylococcus pasteuri]
MTRIIIDGDACPVVNSVIDLTQGTGIFVTIIRSFSHFSNQIEPKHVNTVYVDDGPESVDYKIVQLSSSEDIVITQDYGLASLLLNKVKYVMHHKGFTFNNDNIQQLLDQRYINAQIRKQGGRHKGPPPFTKQDKQHFEQQFNKLLHQL